MRMASLLRRLLVPLALLPAVPALAQYAEAEVKAAFVYNLAKYAEWPEQAHSAGVLRICVLGEPSPLAEALARLEGKPVRGLRIEVRQGMKIAALRPCHVAVVADAEQLPPLEAETATLSVGEGGGFVDAGGMIGLRVEASRVRFDVHLGSAQQSGLVLNSQMLKLAGKVLQ